MNVYESVGESVRVWMRAWARVWVERARVWAEGKSVCESVTRVWRNACASVCKCASVGKSADETVCG